MSIQIDLTGDERSLFLAGVNEWSGPASPTDELALAMGFENRDDLNVQGRRLRELLTAHSPLDAFDWVRVLVMTEFVFASDIFGSGLDWRSTTGILDADAIETLRGLQRKLLQAGVRTGQFGPSSHQEFQWHAAAATTIRIYKRGRLDLRAVVESLARTAESFGDDLADLERTRVRLESLLDLPEDAQRPAALAEFDRLEAALSGRLGEPTRRMFWI